MLFFGTFSKSLTASMPSIARLYCIFCARDLEVLAPVYGWAFIAELHKFLEPTQDTQEKKIWNNRWSFVTHANIFFYDVQ
jgi:hypothetical protein